MENKDILIGIAIGAVLAWIFFGRQSQVSATQLLQMQSRVQILESQLQQYQYQPQTQQQIQQLGPATNITTNTYKNNERWAVSRNKDGFISNIEVIRNASTT